MDPKLENEREYYREQLLEANKRVSHYREKIENLDAEKYAALAAIWNGKTFKRVESIGDQTWTKYCMINKFDGKSTPYGLTFSFYDDRAVDFTFSGMLHWIYIEELAMGYFDNDSYDQTSEIGDEEFGAAFNKFRDQMNEF